MNFTVLTIFPEMINSFLEYGIMRRAIEQNIVSACGMNIRDFAEGKHKVTDDRPYGGGSGMVMKPEPLAKAIAAAKKKMPSAKTILLTPQGKPFNQNTARFLASYEALILVCGRYEGVDERICHEVIDDEISIGDYVLTGGELAAMVIIDAVTRLLPGVLGNADSAKQDSFENSLIEHAQYTRPERFMGEDVPPALISGHHGEIEKWRLESSLRRTFLKRPDMLEQKKFTTQEKEILKKWCAEIEKLAGS